MSGTTIYNRSALIIAHLLFAAILLVAATSVRADSITYNIVDYPAYEADQVTSGTDSVSGYIITDGALGRIDTSDITGGSFTLTSPGYGTSTLPVLGGNLNVMGVTATPTQLLLPNPATYGWQVDELMLQALTPPRPWTAGQFLTTNLVYERFNQLNYPDEYAGWTYVASDPTTPVFAAYFNNNFTRPSTLAGQDPWVIATTSPVPEPTALTLLGTAVLGLGFVYLRRRRAKA